MVSFWDAVKQRSPAIRARRGRISSPIRRRYRHSSFIGTGASGEDRQRDYPSYLQTSNAVYACVNARTRRYPSLPLPDLQQAPE